MNKHYVHANWIWVFLRETLFKMIPVVVPVIPVFYGRQKSSHCWKCNIIPIKSNISFLTALIEIMTGQHASQEVCLEPKVPVVKVISTIIIFVIIVVVVVFRVKASSFFKVRHFDKVDFPSQNSTNTTKTLYKLCPL